MQIKVKQNTDEKGEPMGFLTGKTAIITGAGRAVLSDGRCGSIGYGIATTSAAHDTQVPYRLAL